MAGAESKVNQYLALESLGVCADEQKPSYALSAWLDDKSSFAQPASST
jgi:hypothetical protein